MERFRLEVNFLGLSKETVRGVLKISKRNHYIRARGSWELRRKGLAIGPNNTEMVSYQLVTPLINIDEIDVLKDLLASLYEEAGCIICDDAPVKIYFLGKFRNGLARRVVYELVSSSKFMYTLVMYRKHFSKFRFASYEYIPDGEVFIPYNSFFNTVRNGYNTTMVEELVSEVILEDVRP